MPLTTACTECGQPITLTDEMVQEALDLKVPLVAKHDVCPETKAEQDAMQRKFRMVISIYEVHDEPEESDQATEELVAQMGETLSAASFTDAIPKIGASLNEQWDKIMEQAPVIDGGVAPPKPSAASGLILPPHK